jgi:hypothetical protein
LTGEEVEVGNERERRYFDLLPAQLGEDQRDREVRGIDVRVVFNAFVAVVAFVKRVGGAQVRLERSARADARNDRLPRV